MREKWIKMSIMLILIAVVLVGASIVGLNGIDDSISLPSNEISSLEPMLPVTMECDYQGDNCNICYKLCDTLPIKRVNVELLDNEVILGGQPLGIDLKVSGLIVLDKMKIVTDSGVVSPLDGVDIAVGDVLTHVNAVPVSAPDDIQSVLDKSDGTVVLTIKRGSSIMHLPVKAARDSLTGTFRLGLCLKDGIQGIGTLTFINPRNGRYGALGHVIKDGETNTVYTRPNGNIYNAKIMDVVRGVRGKAGELSGYFDKSLGDIGTIDTNGIQGIFGNYSGDTSASERVKLGSKYSVRPGKAYIYTTVEGDTPKKYEIEIIKNAVQNESKTRGMLLRVTDKELLAKAGGIVQGMSGSPIVQDGKLVGAVTHVFVGDPTKGYGTYIDWMMKECK